MCRRMRRRLRACVANSARVFVSPGAPWFAGGSKISYTAVAKEAHGAFLVLSLKRTLVNKQINGLIGTPVPFPV